MFLCFDTETTGLPLFDQPSEDERQPHIVQLAAQLCERDGAVRGSLSLTIRPDGWTIPDEVVRIHGISTDEALRRGIDERIAVQAFFELARRAELRVAHNITFDVRIIRIAMKRHGIEALDISLWETMPSYCTMRSATKLVSLPPTDRMLAAGRRTPKSPSLNETYRHLFGEDNAKGHTAAGDVLSCKRIYLELMRRSAEGEAA